MFWHHNLFKQTRYWILKPQTHTHHHHPKNEHVHWGYQFHCVHFSSCDSLCQRMSTLPGCFDPCNSEFISGLLASFPIRATVAVPCVLATWITIHTSATACKTAATVPSPRLREPPRSRARSSAIYATGSASSGESLRTLPTALPTLWRVTLAGSTWPRVAASRSGTSFVDRKSVV